MGLRLKSLARFTRQLATYEDSGVDIRRALESLAKSSADERLSASLIRVRTEIDNGATLCEAYSSEGRRYPKIFLRMTRIGEESGNLSHIYTQLADYFDRQLAMRRRFISRMIYPCFMVGALVLVHSILTAVLGVLADPDATSTDWAEIERVFFRTLAMDVAVLAGIIVAIWLARLVFLGRTVTDVFIITVPPLRGAFKKLMLARFSLSMHLMTGSAIPLPEAVTESGVATGNSYVARVLEKASHRIVEGEQLTPVLRDTGLFPADFIDIVDVAEESGTLSESMGRASAHYTEDAEMAMDRLVSGLAWFIYIVIAGIMAYYIIKLFAGYISTVTSYM